LKNKKFESIECERVKIIATTFIEQIFEMGIKRKKPEERRQKSEDRRTAKTPPPPLIKGGRTAASSRGKDEEGKIRAFLTLTIYKTCGHAFFSPP
jgi:hypothetical protein